MNQQSNGKNNTVLIVVLCFVGVLVAILAVLGMSYVSAYNTGNTLEQSLKAEYGNNKNILANYSQKVMEAAQVPEMARDDLSKLTKDAIAGRYGPDGSKAVFQSIVEQNPHVSETLYIKLQQIVEAGRDEFKTGQTRMIDRKRVYETALGSFWQGTWMRIAGYPKVNLDEYKIVTTDRTETSFTTGREAAPVQLRAAPPAAK